MTHRRSTADPRGGDGLMIGAVSSFAQDRSVAVVVRSRRPATRRRTAGRDQAPAASEVRLVDAWSSTARFTPRSRAVSINGGKARPSGASTPLDTPGAGRRSMRNPRLATRRNTPSRASSIRIRRSHGASARDSAARLRHALDSPFMARKRDGTRVLSGASLAGVLAGHVVSASTWYPAPLGARDGLKHAGIEPRHEDRRGRVQGIPAASIEGSAHALDVLHALQTRLSRPLASR